MIGEPWFHLGRFWTSFETYEGIESSARPYMQGCSPKLLSLITLLKKKRLACLSSRLREILKICPVISNGSSNQIFKPGLRTDIVPDSPHLSSWGLCMATKSRLSKMTPLRNVSSHLLAGLLLHWRLGLFLWTSCLGSWKCLPGYPARNGGGRRINGQKTTKGCIWRC